VVFAFQGFGRSGLEPVETGRANDTHPDTQSPSNPLQFEALTGRSSYLLTSFFAFCVHVRPGSLKISCGQVSAPCACGRTDGAFLRLARKRLQGEEGE
jgi:hypothetical protein